MIKALRKYSLHPDVYEALKLQQDNSCAICGMTEAENGRRLAIDHNHDKEGGESVRGLLCNVCNYQRLPLFGDNPALLIKAAQYLVSPPADSVLDRS